MESIFIVTAVVAVTEALRRVKVGDWFAVGTIFASAVVGALAVGLDFVTGITVADGIVLGLGASGVVTVASRAGSSYKLPNQ